MTARSASEQGRAAAVAAPVAVAVPLAAAVVAAAAGRHAVLSKLVADGASGPLAQLLSMLSVTPFQVSSCPPWYCFRRWWLVQWLLETHASTRVDGFPSQFAPLM